jgi:hypothetical protein
MQHNWFIVVSNSSGSFYTIDSLQADGSKIASIVASMRSSLKVIESRNFSQNEASRMCELLNVEKTILPMINYNPLYLGFYSDSLDDDDQYRGAALSVEIIRNMFSSDIASGLQNRTTANVIGESLSFLEDALGKIPIKKECMSEYYLCFLRKEHLTYVSTSTIDITLQFYAVSSQVQLETQTRDHLMHFHDRNESHTLQISSYGYLDEFMWRERYGTSVSDAFDNIISDIATQYPV